jgi:type II secretory pathway predicted ATPase ExeA
MTILKAKEKDYLFLEKTRDKRPDLDKTLASQKKIVHKLKRHTF